MVHSDKAPAVELRQLTKRFRQTTVVDRLDLTIPQGKIFGLIGPNGAGKSTTLKMLMGLLRISEGSAKLIGMDVRTQRQQLRQLVGYVPESHHIYPWMRVDQAIWFAKSFYAKWNDNLADELCKTMELDRTQKVKRLSKGMKVKLALMLAVCHEPKLLILDEPMSGLDPVAREEFLDGLVRSVCDRNCSVVFSSHTIEDVQRVADTIGLLHNGNLLVHQPIEQLLERTKQIRAVLKDDISPTWFPESTIYQRVNAREWTLSVADYSEELLPELRDRNQLGQIEVLDLNLEQVFKEYVYGRKDAA